MKTLLQFSFCLFIAIIVGAGFTTSAHGQKKTAARLNHSVLDAGNVLLWVSPDTWLDKATWPADGSQSHIYDGGLWVSDGQNVMAWDQWFSDDWEETQPREEAVDASGKVITFYINDATAENSIGLDVVFKVYQWSADDRKDFVILEYELTNTSGATIPNLYVAQHVDPDITTDTNIDNDVVSYEVDSDLIYAHDGPGADPGHLGVMLAGSPGGTTPHTAGAWTIGPADPFNEAAQYALMTGGIDPALSGDTPVAQGDYRFVLTAEPFELQAGATARVAFGLAMGANASALTDAADLIRMIYDGEIVTSEDYETIADRVILEQNFPNPFGSSTEIRFELAAASNVRLVVFDVLGREVDRLVEGVMPAGKHTADFVASQRPAGIYFYRLEAGSFSQTKAMILMK